MRFTSPQNLDTLIGFYPSKLTAANWQEEDPKSSDSSYEARFSNAKLGWIMLSMEPGDGGTRVTLNGPYPNN